MADDIATIGYAADLTGLNKLNRGLDNLGKKGNQAERELTSSTAKISNGFNKLHLAITALSSAMFADRIFKDVDAWTQLNNQLRVVSSSEESLISSREKLNRVAEETRTALEPTVELYSAIARSTQDLGVSTEQAITMTRTLNNLFLAGGKSTAATAGAMIQLSQGFASGVLRGDEFNSVAEGAPRILDAISASTGIARGQLRDFAATGGITSKILVEALQDYAVEAQNLADRTLPTLAQSTQEASDNFMEWAGSSSALSGASSALGSSLIALSQNINSSASAIAAASGVWITHLALVGNGSALAYAKRTAASVASALAARKEIATTIAQTEAEIALLTAQKASWTQSILRVQNEAQRMRFRVQLTAVTNQLTAAEARLTVATTAQAASATALGVAWRFMLGPWGLAITAIGAAAIAFMTTKNNADDLTKSLGAQKDAMSELVDKYKSMTRAGQNKFWVESNSAIVEQLKLISKLNQELKKPIDGIIGIDTRKLKELKEAEKILSDIRARQQAVFNAGMPDNWKTLEEAAKNTNRASKEQNRWAESLRNAIDPARKYRIEIDKVKQGLADGIITSSESSARIKQLTNEMNKAAGTDFGSLYGGMDLVDQSVLDNYKELQSFYESINDIMTDGDIRNQIDLINEGIENGSVSAEKGAIAIKRLQDQLSDGFVEASNSISNVTSSLSGLYDTGSQAAAMLSAVSTAAQTAASVATGNIAGMVSGAIGIVASIDSMFGEIEDLSANIQAKQFINMWGDKSDSIAKSTAIAADATEKLVGINTSMLSALTNLTSAISSASGMIVKGSGGASVDTGSLGISSNIFTQSAIGDNIVADILFNPINDMMFDFFNTLTLGVFGKIGSFFGGSSSVTDSGVKIIGGTIANLINDTMVQSYQTVSYKKWRWGGTKSSTAYKDMDAAVRNQFSLVFQSLADSVYSAGEAMGFSGDYLESAINNFVVQTRRVSLKGMSTEEKTSELESYFSDVFNGLAVAILPRIGELQNTGEELATTLTRVATQTQVLNYMVDNLGVIANHAAIGVVFSANSLSQMMGGYDKFSESVSSFVSAFASDNDKLDIYSAAMITSLSEIGLELPTTSKGFYELLNGLNSANDVGRNAIATVLGLTDTATAYYSLLSDTQESMSELADTFASAVMSIYDVSDGITQVSLDAALAAARLGDFSLAKKLDTSSYNVDKDDFSSLTDYNRAQAVASNKLYELSQLAKDQSGDVETQQLDALKALNKMIIEVKYAMESNAKSTAVTASKLTQMLNSGILTYTD